MEETERETFRLCRKARIIKYAQTILGCVFLNDSGTASRLDKCYLGIIVGASLALIDVETMHELTKQNTAECHKIMINERRGSINRFSSR